MDPTTLTLDSAAQLEIIQALREKLKACYVFPNIAGEICAGLQKHQSAGDYAEPAEAGQFAQALTLHLQEVNHDEHLWVRWHPEPLSEADGQLRNNQEWQEQRVAEARLENFGVHKVERLPGNVGYIDLRYFHRVEWGADTAMAAMSFLANSSGLIIDLRKCAGGYPGMIALIATYFFGEKSIHLSSIYWRDDNVTQQYWTWPYVPGKRLLKQPLYVLTSQSTFSAGEGFASILQGRKRVVVIGEKTAGGAHPGASYRLHPHFEVFIPVGRAFDPATGRDLEGTGVTPDVCVPAEQAFLTAYHMALEKVLAGLGEPASGPHKALAEEARLALEEQGANVQFCPLCGYQNPLSFGKCKNCDAELK
jgi:Peptidase family S41/N-terminal domain of Peptidase_S41 in eukaryotic IRBP